MKYPSPADFVIDVTEAHVNVTFKPNGRLYCFAASLIPRTSSGLALSREAMRPMAETMLMQSTWKKRSHGWHIRWP